MTNVYIVDGSRTPFLKARGCPGPFSATDLAVKAAQPLLLKHKLSADVIDEVVVGCVMPRENEANIARLVALRLGCPNHTPAWTVQRNCGSGLQAIDCAYKDISTGRHDVVLAGGTEAMSHAPLMYNDSMTRWLAELMQAKSLGKKLLQLLKLRPYFFKPILALLKGLSDPLVGLSMGQTAEKIAFQYGLTRTQMDQFAVESHQKLHAAYDFLQEHELMTLFDQYGHFYEHDDGVRPDSTVDKLGKLKPFFDKKFGAVTAGNSSQVSDGACMVLMANESAIKKYQLPVLGKIVDTAWAGCAPETMGYGPVFATQQLLKQQALHIHDIDYWEINEAFAAQVLGCIEAFKDPAFAQQHFGMNEALGELPLDRLNVHGGAVAVGHPVGTSGARVTFHLLNILKAQNAKRGVATMCIGGGQGGAIMVERVVGGV